MENIWLPLGSEMLQLILIVPKVLGGGKGQNILSCR